MKKIIPISLFLLISFTFYSQERSKPNYKYLMTCSWERLGNLEIDNYDSIPNHGNLFGAGFDMQLHFKKWAYSFSTTFGFSDKEEFGYESGLASVSFGLHVGRKIKIGNKFEIIPMLGYNYNGYNYDISRSAQVVNFNSSFTPTKRELLNSAHRISPRIVFASFDDIQLAVSYNWDFSKNTWSLETGRLLNSPKDNFSSFSVSFGFTW